MTGISASAWTTNSYTVWLERHTGAPSNAGSFYQSWNYTTTGTTIAFDITTFYRSDGATDSYVTCFATVDGSTKIDSDVRTVTFTQSSVIKGKNGTASAELKNYGGGTHQVSGSFEF